MKDNQKMSSKQLKALVVTVVIGVGVLSLPSKIARIQGNDGWIPIILIGLLIILSLIIINKLFGLYPDKDFFEIGEEVLGKWIFKGFLIIFSIHFILSSASVARSLAEIIKAFLLVTTPTEVIIATFLIATSYLARSDTHMIGRASYHIYPIIIGLTIILTLISLTNVDLTNMLPVFQSNLKEMPKSLEIAFYSYSGFEILLFFIPLAEDREDTLRPALKAIGIVMAMYVTVFVLSLSQYGLDHLQRQTFPTLAMIKEIDLPGFFIENLDGLVVAIWILVIFGTMAPYYYCAGKVISKILNTRSHDLFIIPLLPIIYIISLMPPNIIELDSTLNQISDYIGIFSIIVMPAIIYFVGYYKVRRLKN